MTVLVFLEMSIRMKIYSAMSECYLMLFYSVSWELSLAVLRIIVMPNTFT